MPNFGRVNNEHHDVQFSVYIFSLSSTEYISSSLDEVRALNEFADYNWPDKDIK